MTGFAATWGGTRRSPHQETSEKRGFDLAHASIACDQSFRRVAPPKRPEIAGVFGGMSGDLKLVYVLYGLTSEEIAVVEESTHAK